MALVTASAAHARRSLATRQGARRADLPARRVRRRAAPAAARLGLALAFGAFLAFNYFFLPPYLTLAIADPLDWLVLVTFLITSIVAAQLLYRATSTAEAATARAAEVDRLATLGAETLNLARPEDALRAILDVIRTTLGVVSCDVMVRATSESFIDIARSAGVADRQPSQRSSRLGGERRSAS